MREKVLIILYGLFCLFSENALSAAALSAPEFHETEGYKRWTKLKYGVERHIAPFDLPPFFITIAETKLLVESVQKVLDSLKPETLVGERLETGDRILSLVAGYKAREPKNSKTVKDRFGRAKDVYAPEMFSVPSKMDIFPTRVFVDKEGEGFTVTNVGREDIYKVVIGIVRRLGEVLTAR